MGGVWEMGDGDRVEGRQKSQRLRKGTWKDESA
jgi:hypothetical protein